MEEKQKEEIKKEAKKILDSFGKALEKVELKGKEFKKDEGGFRSEGNGVKADSEFRKIMFANAPKVEEECIIAEKKSW